LRHFHITRQLLRAMAAGTRNPGDLADLAIGHLFTLCSTCRSEYDKWTQESSDGGSPASYTLAVERVIAASETMAEEIAEERQAAKPRLEALLALPRAERLGAIQGAPQEYQGPAIAELLIDESLGQMPGRPRDAMALAELALAILHHSEDSGIVLELHARATAHVGNAFRVCGQLPAASFLLGSARFLLRGDGGGDRLVRAELDSLEGSLRRDQRRFDEAEVLLERAVLTYVGQGFAELAGRTRIILGSVHHEQGNTQAAAEQAEQALQLLDSDEDAGLCLIARQNLADCFCELGRYSEALELIEKSKRGKHLDQISLLRVSWVEGKIARGLGRREEAESHLLASRHGFLKHEIAFDAALVSLELASLYLEEGRTAEVRELATEMVAVFTRQGVHGEATSAWMLFKDAAELERVTVGLIQKMSSYLVRAQRDPAYPFEVAS